MTVLLVLATFAVFLLLDYFYSREPAVQREPASEPKTGRLRPEFVAGFQVPGNVRYHPGHTWALQESPDLVRVGLDDFAARLLGKVAQAKGPQRGQWVRQGQPIFTFTRDGQQTQLLSPIEGMVTEVNDPALGEPAAVAHDPYGNGWLLKVQSPDAATNFRNLLSGAVARKWMEEASARLFTQVPALAGAVAQDGGPAVSDIAAELPDADWAKITKEFFLS